MPKVRNCARCGGDHNELEWEELERPIEDNDGIEWTHWCPCPKNGQPILCRMTPGEQTTENAVGTP